MLEDGLRIPLGLTDESLMQGTGKAFTSISPINGIELARVNAHSTEQIECFIAESAQAFTAWRTVPAPVRGELIRQFGDVLRKHKQALGRLVSLEVGKITAEAEGEVQEMIDICDFAVGQSRQLYGLTIQSERPEHRLAEHWHPLGPIGVITAFNFPVAVWAWNAALALVCGDPVVWKPSEKAPLCAVACSHLLQQVVRDFETAPQQLNWLVQGDVSVGSTVAGSEALPMISATGSVRMGRAVASTVGQRLGRTLLELGGNNAMIVSEHADLELALRAITFSAVGTCGQRCTTLRRLICHRAVCDELVTKLKRVFEQLAVGDPTQPSILIGPLIDHGAGDRMEHALDRARQQGGRVFGGGRATGGGIPEGGCYVRPAIVEIDHNAPIVREETFAPILYVLAYGTLDEAITMNNSVPQGLSSAIITEKHREALAFLGPAGSDCGIANLNIGTSGAEIGGAFGGEKDTGGGRESGSDAWKNYMRRSTQTLNYGSGLPLAQGIEFS